MCSSLLYRAWLVDVDKWLDLGQMTRAGRLVVLGVRVSPGILYLAPEGRHIELGRDRTIYTDRCERLATVRPSLRTDRLRWSDGRADGVFEVSEEARCGSRNGFVRIHHVPAELQVGLSETAPPLHAASVGGFRMSALLGCAAVAFPAVEDDF